MFFRRATTLVLLCTLPTKAARLDTRNRKFTDQTAEAEISVFNHSLAVLAGQSIGASTPNSQPGPLLCPTGVCADDSYWVCTNHVPKVVEAMESAALKKRIAVLDV
ncbi:uncharacterized protein SPSK_03705 [Sporothrix schenckii 1099-18]|uniref:Uncharacterized protein n=1 Tax=Sporothrix schenckii 1099-18 TaxID=1397361 RepID=A0A0F2LYW7_SPOSC|nr:uncharacterized protein SPSK_03705 [Sporothrix schenckii 1099-18]KJR82024.1 hypothetical protein SPSK_03705 [Sporothrix schenckii 1099-18]